MLKDDAVRELVNTAVGTVLAGHDVRDVAIEPSVDWVGEDSLRIKVTVGDDESARPGPDARVDLMNMLRDQMTSQGDMRMPYVYVYTLVDLAEDVESEP